ncbi:hypothetical protein HY745_09735 [Candidatus Desantisbacteria bacterium]|nr:hypothetical protein [Candidatus Desantisbacteria bacterium]
MKFEKKLFLLIFTLLILSVEIFLITGCASDDRKTQQAGFIPNTNDPLERLPAPTIDTIAPKLNDNFGTTGITITWFRLHDQRWVDDEQPATYRIVWYNIFKDAELIKTIADSNDIIATKMSYSDISAKTKGTYSYQIQAIGSLGEKGGLSFPESFTLFNDVK